MPYLKTLTPTTTHHLGNKDRKKLNLPQSLYKITNTRENISIITENSIPIYILSDKLLIPTIRNVSNSNIVVLDRGAYNPIISGANVMAPGIFKYKSDLVYSVGDIVFVRIEEEIVAVGVATMEYENIMGESKGVAIEIWQRVGDYVDKLVV